MWDTDDILDQLAKVLRDADQARRDENCVEGLDALPETSLQELLAQGLAQGGTACIREQPYPGPAGSRARRSARERCDLVLLPAGCTGLLDPVAEQLERDRIAGTLFESAPAPAAPTTTLASPEEAYWLEIKVVGQYAPRAGVPEPNTGYASELTGAFVQDIAKLAREPRATHAGALLVLFTSDDAIATHDVAIALHRVIDRGLAFRAPRTRHFPIPDRIGNQVCSLVIVERAGLGPSA